MDNHWNDVKTRTLSPEEIETLLAAKFGDRVGPIKPEELSRKHRSDAIRRAVKIPVSARKP